MRGFKMALLVVMLLTGLLQAKVFVQGNYYQYTDKQFGTLFKFTPVPNQVMIKFTPADKPNYTTTVEAVTSKLNLNTVHDVFQRHQFGIFEIEKGGSMTSVLQQLEQDPLIQAAAPAMTDHNGDVRYFIPNEFTVQFKASLSREKMQHIIDIYSCPIKKVQWTYGYYTLMVPDGHDPFEMVNLFMAMPEVQFAELSFISFNDYSFDPNDIDYADQWSLNNTGTTGGTADADIDAREGWDIERGDPDILIVIIDSGVDWHHPDLRGNIAQNLLEDADGDGHTIEPFGGTWIFDPGDVNGVDNDGNGEIDDLIGWDFADDDNDPMGIPLAAWDDDYAHGTCCAGIAAAVTDNVAGIAGVAHQCRILPLRINLTSGVNQNRADAINYAATFTTRYDGVVLSCSWKASGDHTAIHTAMQTAQTAGCVTCFAAGNSDTTPINYPARYNECIAVGATSECDERKSGTSCDGEWWWGSQWGDELDVSAPGVHMPTTDIVGADGYTMDSYVDNFNGTSSATPVAAGLAALLLSYDNTLTPAEVQEIMESSADKVGGYDYNHAAPRPGHSIELGYGRINVERALQMVMARTGGLTDLLPTPTDLMLTIDHSGSMIGDKLAAVKNAASQVVRLMNIGDHIGVNKYDDVATPVYPAGGGTVEITTETVKDLVIDAINLIFTGGRTAIGGGLQHAQTQLETISTPNYPQNIILLSDGLSNEPPWIAQVTPTLPTATDVYTLGFGTAGSSVDEDSLQYIASNTGGIYLFAGADGLMNPAPGKKSQIAQSSGGVELIRAYQTFLNMSAQRQILEMTAKTFKRIFADTVYVDESIYEVRFTVLWDNPENKMQVTLESPSGDKIDPTTAASDPQIDYIEDRTLVSYIIRKPKPGRWIIHGQGSGNRYYISVSGYSYLKSFLWVETFGLTRPMLIKCKLVNLGKGVRGAEVHVKVGFPNNEYTQIPLYDDGNHGDGMAGDGLYANYFEKLSGPGSYFFEANVTGFGASKKDQFNRTSFASAYLKKQQDRATITVAMPHIVAPAGDIVKIPILVKTNVFNLGITSFAAKLTFESEILKPTGEVLTEGTLCQDKWEIKTSNNDGFEIQGSGKELTGRGILVYLLFKVGGKEGAMSKLGLSEFTFKTQLKTIEIIKEHGSFTVGTTLLDAKVERRDTEKAVPTFYAMEQNYPNPFNPTTQIQYQLPQTAEVSLEIFNILGQKVATLVNQKQIAGFYTCTWNGVDDYGQTVASGLYLYR
ncbi:S8 family serine peptidase, partial [candidate division KSB1 bacterium]|nr:S8 family serine peptidase [candidate division KSB1 bacterium]